MLTQDQLRTLAVSRGEDPSAEPVPGTWWAQLAEWRQAAFEALGSPADDKVVGAALALVADPDRNLRVMALRALGWYRDRADVSAAMVQASRDPVRRVRRVALKLLSPDRPEDARRLLEVAQDRQEYHRIRTEALVRLARHGLSNETVGELRTLLDQQVDRRRVLLALLSAPLDEPTRDLLEHIVAIGTKDEAVAATRALCGYRLVRSDSLRPPSAVDADVAWAFTPGSLTKTSYAKFYWVPVNDSQTERA